MLLEYEVFLDPREKPAGRNSHSQQDPEPTLNTNLISACGDLQATVVISYHSVSRITCVSVTKAFSSGRYSGSVLYRC